MDSIRRWIHQCKWLLIMLLITYLFYQGSMMILESFQLINPYERPRGNAVTVLQQIHHFIYEGE